MGGGEKKKTKKKTYNFHSVTFDFLKYVIFKYVNVDFEYNF